MIVDLLENAGRYAEIHPLLKAGFDFLRGTDLLTLPAGRHDVQGDRLFALVNDYTTQPAEQVPFEAHRRYTDIQLMVRGIERIGVTPVSTLKPTIPHVDEKDIAFFAGDGDFVSLREGVFAVFFPQDGHQPGVCLDEPMMVRKVVMKVELGA